MKILLIVLFIYLIGFFISYATELQDLGKFSTVALSLTNPEGADPKTEKVRLKVVYAIVAFFGSLFWPVSLMRKISKREEEVV
ncbi:hypothetical protein [Leptothoe spongobia]|uniref:Uncharacterized protein n=1 Tax=Leptothoe spongobia TAU-MAC 1115 TaxID=1967444 RepID=A0A947GIQ8_9CYAN|nr:hypothetical protein [Leptothoe spongobia]MBT9315057.1 hypothetical protein [Leptothoe spongobia TAU-MAC 1115]